MKKFFAILCLLPAVVFAETYECSFFDLKSLNKPVFTGQIEVRELSFLKYFYAQADVNFLCATIQNSQTKNFDLTCGISKPNSKIFEHPTVGTRVGSQTLSLSGSIEDHPLGISCNLL